MSEEKETPSGTIIKDRSTGYYIVKNVIVDKWLRVVGPDAFVVWHLFKSMCKGNSEVVFLKVRQKDWAEYCGIGLQRFQRALKRLSEVELLFIELPIGEDRLRHYATTYVLNELPDQVPEEFIKPNIKPFTPDCRFIDPLSSSYSGEKMLKGGPSTKSLIHKNLNKSKSINNVTGCSGHIKTNMSRIDEYNMSEYKLQTIKSTDEKEISNDIYKDSPNPQKLVTNSSQEKSIPLTRTKFPNNSLHERIKEKVGTKVEKPVPVMDPIIIYMNNRLPGPKLRGFKSNSRPYDNYTRAVRYIKQLKSGTHGKFWNLPEEYLKRNNIPHEVLSHMFTEKEIKQTISKMSGIYKEGYYTDDKTWLMKLSRDMLIYKPIDIGNPFPQSLFLEVAVNGVRETCYTQIQREWETSKYKSQMDTLCEIFQIDKKDTSKRGLILKYMDKMDKFIDSLPKDMGRYSYFVHSVTKGSGPLFMDHYIYDWLATHDKGEWYRDNQNIGCLNITSKLFREYIAYHWDESQIGPVMEMNYAAYGFEYFLNKHLRGETIAERIHQKEQKSNPKIDLEECDKLADMSDEEYDEKHYYPEHPDERPSVKQAEEEEEEEEDTPKVVVDTCRVDLFDETLDDEDDPE